MASEPLDLRGGLSDYHETAAKCALFLEHRACPRHCGELLIGKDFQRHMDEECPFRQVLCRYGCGDSTYGYEQDGGDHVADCPMNIYLTRAEAALRESAVKEYRLAMEGAYAERENARMRIMARKERDPGPVFTSAECRKRVGAIESKGHDLITKSRRKAREKLVSVIAIASMGPEAAEATEAPMSAAKLWDAVDNTKEFSRSARPWDVAAPILEPLMDVLEEARACGADIKLRRQAEALLLAAIRRALESALGTLDVEEKSAAVEEALESAYAALSLCELVDLADIPVLLEMAEKEGQRAGLRALEITSNEFHDAVKAGDVDLVTWFLDKHQANPSLPDPRTGLPPLVLAAKSGDLPMCELLLDRGVEVDGRCRSDGTTSLHWACHGRLTFVATLLLAKGANPRLQDKRGQDSLMKLVKRDFYKPAEGCAYKWESQSGRQLSGPELPNSGYMDFEGAQLACEQDLNCVGFSIDTSRSLPGGHFYTTLHAAGRIIREVPEPPPPIEEPKEDVQPEAKAKADAKAKPKTPAKDRTVQKNVPVEVHPDIEVNGIWSSYSPGWTCYLKVPRDPAHDVSALIAAGGDTCSEDLEGLTPLHHHLLNAPGRGSPSCVAALLRGGADVNQRDVGHRSTTPFIIAIQVKRVDLVQLMMKESWPPADVDTKASDGTSALALAKSRGAREIVDLLVKAGASEWDEAEVVLGSRTTFSIDTRKPPPSN
eukprot:TRINITY_DN23481_c0_g1_i1.p1 TRINITY_DN23481_c0_g1~~TRINITY_DN23481_c0_g1_i1.p1  ORF type:complete len:729 (+),score=122.91 TRINITY_DN23481_c0_g1_i1:38-2188(+)